MKAELEYAPFDVLPYGIKPIKRDSKHESGSPQRILSSNIQRDSGYTVGHSQKNVATKTQTRSTIEPELLRLRARKAKMVIAK